MRISERKKEKKNESMGSKTCWIYPDFEHEEPKETPTNCKNCGAPLENGKCKYCGTEYR